ncbi:MAG: PHB depolymerase family esterase [Chitinophagaceae bacterium]|nr:PHB depolymerase family esterase [Rubrivivax sp.]
MQLPFNARAPSFDANAINQTIQRALASAGLDTTSGPMHAVTETIRQALASGGLATAAAASATHDDVIDVAARVVRPGAADIEPSDHRLPTARAETPGTFTTCLFSNASGNRAYKLYVPATPSEAPRPMVVMLHGCTQSADDFAAGTQMNRLADEHGFLVVYPEQPAQANMSKCWNWFQPQDQLRDTGEPSLIAGIVRQVASRHGADLRGVFVAGLSAGAAMAVVLGETHPDLFAGIGVHSGLPYGSAHDIPSAMAAMKGGRSGMPGLQVTPDRAGLQSKRAVHAVPTIVFHGDRDHTVQQTNAKRVVQQARDAYSAEPGATALTTDTHRGTAPGGRSYSRTVYADSTGRAHIEDWTIHGAGHAWSGGDEVGSYTDRTGPDASGEMVRFFLSLARAGSA